MSKPNQNTPKRKPPQPKLPLDVLTEIISRHIPPPNPTSSFDPNYAAWSDFQSLSLVSRAFAHECRRRLFGAIDVSYCSPDRLRCLKLQDFIRHPYFSVAPYVRTIRWVVTEDEELYNALTVFMQCTNLRTLEIVFATTGASIGPNSKFSKPSILDALLTHFVYGGIVTSLSIKNADHCKIPLRDILQSPSLESLEIINPTAYDISHSIRSHNGPYNLKHLRVVNDAADYINASARFPIDILRNCSELKSLEFCDITPPSPATIASTQSNTPFAFERLEKLVLKGSLQAYATLFRFEDAARAGVNLFPNVTDLHIKECFEDINTIPNASIPNKSPLKKDRSIPNLRYIDEDHSLSIEGPQLRKLKRLTIDQQHYSCSGAFPFIARTPLAIMRCFGALQSRDLETHIFYPPHFTCDDDEDIYNDPDSVYHSEYFANYIEWISSAIVSLSTQFGRRQPPQGRKHKSITVNITIFNSMGDVDIREASQYGPGDRPTADRPLPQVLPAEAYQSILRLRRSINERLPDFRDLIVEQIVRRPKIYF